jgi:hypothetical protein
MTSYILKRTGRCHGVLAVDRLFKSEAVEQIDRRCAMDDNHAKVDKARRKFMRKAAYLPPAVAILSAMPFTASYGSQSVSDTQRWEKSSERGKRSANWDKADRSKRRHWNRQDD